VHKGKDSFPIDQQTEALSLFDACKMLEQLSE
jgi:hypothetical protein